MMEQLTKHRTYDSQHELLARYCAEAETVLKTAPTRDRAELIREELCSRFESECGSRMIVNGTREYINGLIDALWPGSSPNENRTGHNH